MATTVLAFSGGLASTTLLWQLRQTARRVRCVYVDYGQQCARSELEAADQIVRDARLRRLEPIELTAMQVRGFPARTFPTHGLSRRQHFAPIAPLLLTCAALHAASINADTVACAAGMDDLPESENFDAHVATIINAIDSECFADFPFRELHSPDIMQRAARIQTPLHKTWSCLLEGREHCGTCVACRDRSASFAAVNSRDETAYADDEPDMLQFVRCE